MIKAIDTYYGGHLFRSRLEARWAVFFDELGWSWEYEKEGFVLEDGTHYLPDFYLPDLDTWFEVKKEKITERDVEKCLLLSKGLPENTCVMIGNGLPCAKQYPVFVNGDEICGATLTVYIKWKGWSSPYFGGDWVSEDNKGFSAAKTARFEFGETPNR